MRVSHGAHKLASTLINNKRSFQLCNHRRISYPHFIDYYHSIKSFCAIIWILLHGSINIFQQKAATIPYDECYIKSISNQIGNSKQRTLNHKKHIFSLLTNDSFVVFVVCTACTPQIRLAKKVISSLSVCISEFLYLFLYEFSLRLTSIIQ